MQLLSLTKKALNSFGKVTKSTFNLNFIEKSLNRQLKYLPLGQELQGINTNIHLLTTNLHL